MGAYVGQRPLEPLMAAQQRPVAQLQPLVKDGPELVHISAGGQGYIGQVDGYHALVEPAVVLVLAGLIIAGIGDVADAGIGETGPVSGRTGSPCRCTRRP